MSAPATTAPSAARAPNSTRAVDTLGHLLMLHVTAANEQDRAQVAQLAQAVQQVTGNTVEAAFVDQGSTVDNAASQAARLPGCQAARHGIDLLVVKHTEAKRGFVLLPHRWVVERRFGWAARFRRLARDYERPTQTLAGRYHIAFACLMLSKTVSLFASGSFQTLGIEAASTVGYQPALSWTPIMLAAFRGTGPELDPHFS